MSARQTLILCIDCWAFDYGVPDSNGVHQRDSAATNHWEHAVHVFGTPNDYPPPIRNVLACLQSGLPVSDARIAMFSLACAVHAIQPTNGRRPTFGEEPPPVVEPGGATARVRTQIEQTRPTGDQS